MNFVEETILNHAESLTSEFAFVRKRFTPLTTAPSLRLNIR